MLTMHESNCSLGKSQWKWMSECVSEWVREWTSEWASEWAREWAGEWVSQRVSESLPLSFCRTVLASVPHQVQPTALDRCTCPEESVAASSKVSILTQWTQNIPWPLWSTTGAKQIAALHWTRPDASLIGLLKTYSNDQFADASKRSRLWSSVL